jgi:predicted transcriptional regulator
MEMRAITTRIDIDTDDALERIAARRGMSKANFAADALCIAVRKADEFAAFVQVGIDAADRGELTPQDKVFAQLRERRQRLRGE